MLATCLKSVALPLFVVLQVFAVFLINPHAIYADDTCSTFQTDPAQPWQTKTDIKSVTIGGGLVQGTKYYLYLGDLTKIGDAQASDQHTITIDVGNKNELKGLGSHTLSVRTTQGGSAYNICTFNYTVTAGLRCSIAITDEKQNKSFGPGDHVTVNGLFDWTNSSDPYNEEIDLRLWYQNTKNEKQRVDTHTNGAGVFSNSEIQIPALSGKNDVGWWRVSASKNKPKDFEKELCVVPIYVSETSGEPVKSAPPGTPPQGSGQNPCQGGKCDTAIGEIPTDPAGFIKTIFGIALGLAGAVALIFMVMGSIKVITSSGDQKKLTEGKDQIVAAVAGLLFIIFSVLILRFIGGTLLGGIPGLQ